MSRPRNRRNQGAKWIRRTTRLAIYARDGFCCVYCGANGELRRTGLALDHIVPSTKGGTNDPSNLVTCCKWCNDSKRHLDLAAWLPRWWDAENCALILARVAAAVARDLDRALGRRLEAARFKVGE